MRSPTLGQFPSVIEQRISRALDGPCPILVRRPGHEDGGDPEERFPLFLDTLFAETAQAAAPPAQPLPQRPHGVDDDVYKRLIQSTLACWQADSVSSFASRIALCDWVARALKVSPALHQAALLEAVQSNAYILERLQNRLRLLSEDISAFSAIFPTEEGASKYRFEEITNLQTLVRNKHQNAPYAGLLEVAVLQASGVRQQGISYVNVTVPEQRRSFIKTGKRRRTRLTSHAKETGAASWMEKLKPIAVSKRDVDLEMQVRVCHAGKLQSGGDTRFQGPLLEGASRLSCKVAGEIAVAVPRLASAVLPTSLTYDLHAPSVEKSTAGTACFGGGSKLRADGNDTPNGKLHVVVRFMEEWHSPKALEQFLPTFASSSSGDRATNSQGTRQSEASDGIYAGSLPQQMRIAENYFQAVVVSVWHAWEGSIKFYGMHDSEVSDDLHCRMASERHTFMVSPESDMKCGEGGQDEPADPILTYATGAAISPGVSGLVSDQVKDVELHGFSPDHSWWVVIQRFCTMYRVRRQRRDIEILNMMLQRWLNAFGYLRALRGVLQPLVAEARKHELTDREFSDLRGQVAEIASQSAAALTNGPGELLKYSFDEAVATFKELQRLLLLSCAGDEASWSTEIDAIVFRLLARGAVKRLTARVEGDHTEKELSNRVAQNIALASNELQIDLILRPAYLGGADFCQHTAFMRYQEITRELALIGILGGGATKSSLSYSRVVQAIEDELYTHHRLLAKENLINGQQQLLDPLCISPPTKIIDLCDTFGPLIWKWIEDSKSLTWQWVQNAVELDREDSHSTDSLSPSLLEMFRVVQEMLKKISLRTFIRTPSLTRRLAYGDELLDLFRGSILTYADLVSQCFGDQLEASLSNMLSRSFPLRARKGSGTGTGCQPYIPILKLGSARYINDLWLVLCNHHTAERAIQESSVKGCDYTAVQLDVGASKLQVANDRFDCLSLSSTSVLSLSSRSEDDIVEEWETHRVAKLKDVQQSISSLLLEMIVGVGNTYGVVVSTTVEYLSAKDVDSQGGLILEMLEDFFGGELQLLNSLLNQEAFALVLEGTWYRILRMLEAIVLQTSHDYGLASNDDARAACHRVLELLSSLWLGNGIGLPSELIHETSARLNSLLHMHASSVPELKCFLQQAMAGETAVQDGLGNSISLRLGDISTKDSAPSQLAHVSITEFIRHMKSSTTREVGLLELMRLLRQRSGDRAAEALGNEIAEYAAEHIQEMLGLEGAGALLKSWPARLQEYRTQGTVFILSHFVVFTDVFSISITSNAMQAVGIGRPSGDVTEVLPFEHIIDVQECSKQGKRWNAVQLTMMDNTARTFELESANTARDTFLQCRQLAGLELPVLQRQKSILLPRMTELRNSPDLLSWTSCELQQIWGSTRGTLAAFPDRVIFITNDEEVCTPADEIMGVTLFNSSSWSVLSGTGVQVVTKQHKKHFYKMEHDRAKEVAKSLREISGK